MPKALIIGNPISGGGKAKRRVAELARLLEGQQWNVETFFTSASGDARRKAQGVKPGDVDAIVCAGGDGTVNEVVNGLADPSHTPIAMLPMGTANLLAKELKLPGSPRGLARLLGQPRVRRIDLCTANDRRFLLLVSAGFDAMVCESIARCRTGSLGYRGYIKPILRTLAAYRPPRIKVQVDDGPPVEGAMVVVSSIKNYGGIFSITDKAECDSGRLDVCVLAKGSIPSLVGYAVMGLAGRVSRLRSVTYLTGTRVRLNGPQPVATELDGDYFAHTPVDISVTQAVVPVLTPTGLPWDGYRGAD